jgi:hypothetical protein
MTMTTGISITHLLSRRIDGGEAIDFELPTAAHTFYSRGGGGPIPAKICWLFHQPVEVITTGAHKEFEFELIAVGFSSLSSRRWLNRHLAHSALSCHAPFECGTDHRPIQVLADYGNFAFLQFSHGLK